MRRALFLDRDGVLNVDIAPYVPDLASFEVFPYTLDALKMFHEAGFEFYVVSNQQGVSLGITPAEELEKMSQRLQEIVRPHGFEFRRFYYATDLDEADHPWRKPKPGMILQAVEDFGISLEGALLVGDKWSDIAAAEAAGIPGYLVYSGVSSSRADWEGRCHPAGEFSNLLEAAHALAIA